MSDVGPDVCASGARRRFPGYLQRCAVPLLPRCWYRHWDQIMAMLGQTEAESFNVQDLLV